MENQYLCDLYREDYEQYLKQAILFSSKINVMYPQIDYPREIDKHYMNEKISSLKKYLNFDNVNIVPMKGKSNRFFDFENNPIVFDTICKELYLTEAEKNCFLEYRDQEFDYLAFNERAPWKDFCSYMHNVFNIAIAYVDMTNLFCKNYLNYQGNVLSNSSFLHNLLTSNAMQAERPKKFSDMSFSEKLNSNRRHFSGMYCNECKVELKPYTKNINPISIKEKLIEILIPDYSELEIDDLYEIQSKAKPEIEQLSAYIDEVSISANNEEDLKKSRCKITASVSELESKIKGIRLTSLQKILSLKEVATIPILIELMPNLPTYVPLALSAAFIAADAGVEIKKEYLQLKQDPMYFTIKLNKVVKRQKQKHHHS